VDTVSEPNCSSTALSSIPLSTWENETHVLDTVVREAVRLSQPFVSFHLNVGPGMYIDGKVTPTGALVAYPAADVHLDPAFSYTRILGNSIPRVRNPKATSHILDGVEVRVWHLYLLPKGIVDGAPGAWVREDDLRDSIPN
jgi:hypothetical protein